MAAPVSKSPVGLKEIFNLTALGVSPISLTFNTCTLESDKYVVVRETLPNGLTQLVVIDTAKPKVPTRKPVQATMAVMNPSQPVIALLFANGIQLFDMGKKTQLKVCKMTENVLFMKWVGVNTLGIVTLQSVYHWRLDDASTDPIKVFDKHESMMKTQLISYRADPEGNWMALVGIAQSATTGQVKGQIQLFSKEKNLTQMIEGHAAVFCSFRYEGNDVVLFVFVAKAEKGNASKLHVIQLGETTPPFGKKMCDVFYPAEAAGDYPVGIVGSSKYKSIVYLVTKMGYVHIYDIEHSKCLYVNRMSDTTLFAMCSDSNGGLMGVNRRGQVLLVSLLEPNVFPYVMSKLKDVPLALSVASRNNLPGAESYFKNQFEELFEDEKYRDAAIVAADSPQGFLRTPATMERFASVAGGDDAKDPVNPLMLYLQTVLNRAGTLNKAESIAIGMQVVRANKAHLLEKWVKEERLEFCEELGDLVARSSLTMALAVYIKAKAHEKVIGCLAASGQVTKVWAYAEKVGMKVTKSEIVEMAARVNPQAALALANTPLTASQAAHQNQIVLAQKKRKTNVDHVAMVDMFMKRGLLKEATSYCLDNLTDDAQDEQEEKLQTRILEANLMNNPQVADMILKQDIWHQFDHFKVAILCERVGFFQHALDLFTDVADIKRVITNTHVLSPETLLTYFAELDPEDALEILEEMMKSSARGNLALCVRIAAKYSDHLGAKNLIRIFEKQKQPDAMFHYLQAIVNFSDEPEVHHRYLEACISLGQYSEVERVTRESNFYDPERVKNLLFSKKLKDPRPLINVCDRFGYIEEMVRFMIKMNQLKFVEGFVLRVNPLRAPVVVGVLLDLQIDNKFILKLLAGVKNHLNVGELAVEVGKRGKLRLIQPVLESRVADGSTDVDVHTALAKVYVDINLNPEHFLMNNAYYDSRQLGEFCTKRDPYLAYIAYARGKCDTELIEVTNEASLFKEQAEYVVSRESDDLWAKILRKENPFRKLVVDQVIGVALPACNKPERVSVAVRAFLGADMPDVLMDLLEKLVLNTANSAFTRNKNLQNMLLLTAIKAESMGNNPDRSGRVMEYLRRMDNYDSVEIAKVALGAGLYEEAYSIYYKFNKLDDALDVLLNFIKDFTRAEEFAARMNTPDVWSKLGEALLHAHRVGDGVRALLKAKDARPYLLVVETARDHASDEEYAVVVKYLKIVRSGIKDFKVVDTEIVYGLCRCKKLHEVQEFLTGRNECDIEDVAERCYDEENWPAAKLLYTLSSNWARLAHVLCELGEFEAALEAAKKAKKLEVWKFLCFKAVDAGELRIAQKAGLNVVIEPEHMYEVLEYYESRGLFDALISLMDAALLLEKAHQALFTETGILYTKYKPEKVMDFCKMWWRRCNVPQLIRACEKAALWEETVYLQIQYEEFDNAAVTMMHHQTAWEAAGFIDLMAKAGSLDVMYRGVQFYASQHPDLLLDLLLVLAPKAESSRVVTFLRLCPVASDSSLYGPELGILPEAVAYLNKVVSIQGVDTPPEVADALIDIYVEEEAVLHLKELLNVLDNFDQFGLASRLENHKLLDFRRLAGKMYRQVGKYEVALQIAKKDRIWRDAVETAGESDDPELCEQLATWFLDNRMREAFTAMLYACFESFPPDVGIELAWTRGAIHFVMPFMIQSLKEVGSRLVVLKEERVFKKDKEEIAEKEKEEEVNEDESVLLFGLNALQAGQQNRMMALPGIPGMSNRGMLALPGIPGPMAGGGYGTVNPGGNMLRLGWNGMTVRNPQAAYGTYAMPMTSMAGPAAAASMYRTNAAMAAYQTNMAAAAAAAQYQSQAYRTQSLHQAYATASRR